MICISRIVAISLIFVSFSFCMENSQKSRERELIDAVIANDLSAVTQLLEQGVSANAKSPDQYGNCALIFAVNDKSIEPEIVKQLLIHGANPNAVDQNPHARGDSALHLAANNHSFPYYSQKIEYLLTYGANPNAEERLLAQTPLFYVVLYSQNFNESKLIPLFLSKKADLNYKDSEHRTPLSFAIDQCHRDAILEILTNKFQQPNLYFAKDRSLVSWAKQLCALEKRDCEKERKQTIQRIGKALNIFEGFYTGRNRIAR